MSFAKNRVMKVAVAFLVVGFFGSASGAVTNHVFQNLEKDWVLDNPNNWNTKQLPIGLDNYANFQSGYNIPVGSYYTMTNTNYELVCDEVKVAPPVNFYFDLGAGNAFLAHSYYRFNGGNMRAEIKSGTIGVKWDGTPSSSVTDPRFFMGDNGDGGMVIVDGPNSVVTGSKKGSLQIGTNGRDWLLKVVNGGTVRANVRLGNTSPAASNNVFWIEGPDSKFESPSDSAVNEALAVGGAGDNCRVVVTNQGTVAIYNSKNVSIGTAGNGWAYKSDNNLFELVDHSTFSAAGEVRVGSEGSTNVFHATGGSTVQAGAFTVGAVPDSHVFNSGRDGTTYSNKALFEGEDTLLRANTVYVGRDYATDAFMSISNRAQVVAKNAYIGLSRATNCVLRIEDGATFLATNGFQLGANVLATPQFRNKVIVDNANLIVSNANASTVVNFLLTGRENVLELTNGARLLVTNCNAIYLGGNNGQACPSNRLVASKGSVIEFVTNTDRPGLNFGTDGPGNTIELDNANFYAKGHLFQPGTAGGNLLLLRNGSTCSVYRVIFNGKGIGNTVDVDDSYFTTGVSKGGGTGGFQMGGSDSSTNHLLHIHGPRARVHFVESSTLARDSEVRFTFEKEGFLNSAVLTSPRGLKPNTNVTPEHPTTIRVDVAPGFAKSGTYTLIQTQYYDLQWTNSLGQTVVNLEVDPVRIQVVEKSNRKLRVRVKGLGLLMVVK